MISEIQNKIDKIKWEDSQKENRDMCGSYDFCKYCVKKKTNPCEKALLKLKLEEKKIQRVKAKDTFKFDGKEVLFRSTIKGN